RAGCCVTVGGDPREPPSFPTRRSSDLGWGNFRRRADRRRSRHGLTELRFGAACAMPSKRKGWAEPGGAAVSEPPSRRYRTEKQGRCCLSTNSQPGGLRIVRVQRPLCPVPEGREARRAGYV